MLVAHPDARLLREWLDLEMCRVGVGGSEEPVPTSVSVAQDEDEDDEPSCEEFRALVERPRPTSELLLRRPELVHRVGPELGALGACDCTAAQDYLLPMMRLWSPEAPWLGWRDQYAVHLLTGLARQWQVNETGFMSVPNTFREMALDVFDVDKGVARLL